MVAAAKIGLLITVVASGLFFWIQRHYSRSVLADVAQVPERPVAIVFGAGIRPDGQLTPMLRIASTRPSTCIVPARCESYS